MHDSDIRAQLQCLFDTRAVPPPTPAMLGCGICAAVGQRAWVARRRAQAEALIRDQGLDHPEIRFNMLRLSSDLCDVCRGSPEQQQQAALHARSFFLAAILPPCTASLALHRSRP